MRKSGGSISGRVAPGALPVAAALGLLLCCGEARARLVERIVAVVNSDIILLSEIDERIRPMLPQLRQIPDAELRAQKLAELKRQALNHVIDEKLIEQEAKKLKLSVSDADLERAVADVMRKNKLSRKELEAALIQEGSTLASYKAHILRPQLMRLRVLNVQVRGRVAVSGDEVRALYQKNLRELGVETKVRARHIFITTPQSATARQLGERQKLAQEILIRARQPGADFAELARKYSQDPVTREEGGDLGYFGRGTLPSGVEDIVFAMKTGEIRGPLRTERGLHIIKLEDRKDSSARSFEDVREELQQQIYARKLEKATNAWLLEVRKKSFIDIKE